MSGRNSQKIADLVLEGGGVKGIGLVGAIAELEREGYSFRRVGGTSAGAIVASLIAAGMPTSSMYDLLHDLPYPKFRDEGLLDKFVPLGKGASLLFEKGIYEGKYLRAFVAEELEKLGVRTWADLKIDDPWCQDYPIEQRYKLVLIVADVTRGTLARLPWDYHEYGLNPDEQLVADAVAASAAIPLYYEPVKLGDSLLVDGGIVANFPLAVLDTTKSNKPPRWPTIGINLSAKSEDALTPNNTRGPISYSLALLETIINARDRFYVDDPAVAMRTIFVDTGKVVATDFDITLQQRDMLYQNGQAAAKKFLRTWNFNEYMKNCYD